MSETEMFYVRFGGRDWDITVSYFPTRSLLIALSRPTRASDFVV